MSYTHWIPFLCTACRFCRSTSRLYGIRFRIIKLWSTWPTFLSPIIIIWLSGYIISLKLIGELSLTVWISFISCALMLENITGITFSAKYLCNGTAYNGQTLLKSRSKLVSSTMERLRVYCYHFCYPTCHFLVLRVAIIPKIIAFLHSRQYNWRA